MNIDNSILISSCDKYSDVWEIFFPLFFKYWPDCPWKIYLGSNEKNYNDSRVTTIRAGKDKSWARSTFNVLEKIPTNNILILLDDFFIFWKVDTPKVIHHYESFLKLNANCLRLRNSPVVNTTVKGFADLVVREKGEFNRVALDIAFWKKKTFLELLKLDENPWQMEDEGSKRSNIYDGFYSTKEWVIERRNGLEGGKWMRYNLDLLEAEGLAIPPGHKIRSKTEEAIVAFHAFLWTIPAYKLLRKYKTIFSKYLKKLIAKKGSNETTD
jgi:hypothetical protein